MMALFPVTTTRGMGWGIPIGDAVLRAEACARELDVAVLANTAASPKAEDESFAEKLTKACEERSGRKRREEQAEQERNRYRHKPRPPCKGE